MAYEQKPDSGSLWRNEYKEKDTQPTHTGTAKIDGVDYKLAAWVNTTKSEPPKKYFSIKFEKKEAAPAPAAAPLPGDGEFDDDIPF